MKPADASAATGRGRPDAPCNSEDQSRDLVVPDDEIDLVELFGVLWERKLLICIVTSIAATLSLCVALLLPPTYRAEVLLAPNAGEAGTGGLGAQLGSLAGLAGISLGGQGNSDEALATLRSRAFAASFIRQNELLPVLFADDWDELQQRWKAEDAAEWPDVRLGVTLLQEDVLSVSQDRATGMVTLAVEWRDAETAARWANGLAKKVNADLRTRSLAEAEASLAYLRSQMAATSVIAIQESIGRLIEDKLKTIMMANASDEFAFRVIDPAVAPREKAKPPRALIAVVGTVFGFILSVGMVLVVRGLRRHRSAC